MTETPFYAVYLFPQAAEALGEPMRAHLQDIAGNAHIVCAQIDTSGPFFGMTVLGKDNNGTIVELEIMIPHSMVKLVMSVHNDHDFGFAEGR
ncbi:MAG: hypothetical protein ABI411_00375 [Tahibacter sp.]